MKIDYKAARKYSQALFECLDLDQIDQSLESIIKVSQTWSANLSLRTAMVNPAFSIKQRQDVLIEVCKSNGIQEQKIINFVLVLFENKRLQNLPQISESFSHLVAEYKKLMEIKITSASSLDEAEKQRISDSLEKQFGKAAKLSWSVDPELIGGYILQAGDKVLDCSVKGSLEQIRQVLTK